MNTRARFLGIPDYTMIPDGKGHWVSQGALRFFSKKLNRVFEIPTHSVNNLASIPRPLRMVFSVNGPHRPASALHDGLYEKPKVHGITRLEADTVFKEAMDSLQTDYLIALSHYQYDSVVLNDLADSFRVKPLVGSWQSSTMYQGVRIGGSSSFNN